MHFRYLKNQTPALDNPWYLDYYSFTIIYKKPRILEETQINFNQIE